MYCFMTPSLIDPLPTENSKIQSEIMAFHFIALIFLKQLDDGRT